MGIIGGQAREAYTQTPEATTGSEGGAPRGHVHLEIRMFTWN